jgi:hypothetical protein
VDKPAQWQCCRQQASMSASAGEALRCQEPLSSSCCHRPLFTCCFNASAANSRSPAAWAHRRPSKRPHTPGCGRAALGHL